MFKAVQSFTSSLIVPLMISVSCPLTPKLHQNLVICNWGHKYLNYFKTIIDRNILIAATPTFFGVRNLVKPLSKPTDDVIMDSKMADNQIMETSIAQKLD